MIHTIENEYFKVKISTKGAELQSVYSKKLNEELLWQGDAAYWGKRSPVLFPIVGSLKEGKYVYNEKEYSLSRHGFARDMEFTHQTSTINSIANFELVNTINTIENFPFEFSLKISYALLGESLMAMYQIQNTSKSENLFASVGVHPAFNVPLFQNTTFEDYFLQFNQDENSNIYPLTVDGLIKNSSVPFFKGNNEIKLEKSLFYTDALVFKDLKSNNIKLLHQTSGKGFNFSFSEGFKYFGLWSAKDAPFVCLEPWGGIADAEDATGFLEQKEGIQKIGPSDSVNDYWEISAL